MANWPTWSLKLRCSLLKCQGKTHVQCVAQSLPEMEAGFVTVITLVTVVTNSHTHSDKLKTFPAAVKLKVQSGSKAGSCPVVVQGLNVR